MTKDNGASLRDRATREPSRSVSALRAGIASAPASEKVCMDCGGPNPVWFAPNRLWNRVIGGPTAKGDPGGIYCPCCFIVRAEMTGITPTAWVLEPEEPWREPTIKEMTAEILPDFPGGLTCRELIVQMHRRFGERVQRKSLSPQLTRMKAEGHVTLNGSRWKSAQAIEARQGGDGTAPSQDESAVRQDAPGDDQ